MRLAGYSMVCSICTTGVMTLGGKSSSLSRFGLASKERLPNCAHRHLEDDGGKVEGKDGDGGVIDDEEDWGGTQ